MWSLDCIIEESWRVRLQLALNFTFWFFYLRTDSCKHNSASLMSVYYIPSLPWYWRLWHWAKDLKKRCPVFIHLKFLRNPIWIFIALPPLKTGLKPCLFELLQECGHSSQSSALNHKHAWMHILLVLLTKHVRWTLKALNDVWTIMESSSRICLESSRRSWMHSCSSFVITVHSWY